MRTFESDDCKIIYPNKTAFCFSPVIVDIQKKDIDLTFATIRIYKDTGDYWTEEREMSSGRAVFDISRYAQMLFSTVEHSGLDYSEAVSYSPHMKSAIIEIRLYISKTIPGGDSGYIRLFPTDLDFVWGSLEANEQVGGYKKLVWFVNYPFTIDLCCRPGNYFDVVSDGKPQYPVFNFPPRGEGIKSEFLWHIVNIGKLFKAPRRELYIAYPYSKRIKNGVESMGVTSYRLEVNRALGGIYLRWTDWQGRYCYYLFHPGSESIKVGEEVKFRRIGLSDAASYVNGVNRGDGRMVTKDSVVSVALVAPLVDEEIFSMLTTLLTSPVVDRYMGEDTNGPLWQRVNIATGSFTKTAKKLQDFTCQMELPQQNIPRL